MLLKEASAHRRGTLFIMAPRIDFFRDEGGDFMDRSRPCRESAPFPSAKSNPEAIIINEAQLLLAEKRTSLAVMRTGIAVMVIPLSVFSLLIATSRYYDVSKVIPFLVPLSLLNLLLVMLGVYLIIRSFLRMRRQENLLQKIKSRHGSLEEFID